MIPIFADFEGDGFGEDVDRQIVNLIYKRLSERYELPRFNDIQDTLLIAYGIVNAIFTLSFRRHQNINRRVYPRGNSAFIVIFTLLLTRKVTKKKISAVDYQLNISMVDQS